MKTVIVIGGGLSGLQAGVFTAKAGEETLVLDTDESLVYNTSNIQNLVGHDSVSGEELLRSGRDKLEEFGGEFKQEKVESVKENEEVFLVTTEESRYESEYLVLASAGILDYAKTLELELEEGVDEIYMMDEHVKTDESNKAVGTEKVYAAGLANTWEYQVSVAIGDGAKAAVNLLTDKYGEHYQDHDT